MTESLSKAEIRRILRQRLAGMTDEQRRLGSAAACALLLNTPEFAAARTVMIYLSTPAELDTAPIALRALHEGKTVAAPVVDRQQRRLLPVALTSLHEGLRIGPYGIREPAAGTPLPLHLLDLVIVPALGFTPDGGRIGRGMGYYDRFLAQREFAGIACGLGFEQQVMEKLPLLDHDMRLGMLVTDRAVRRFLPPDARRTDRP